MIVVNNGLDFRFAYDISKNRSSQQSVLTLLRKSTTSASAAVQPVVVLLAQGRQSELLIIVTFDMHHFQNNVDNGKHTAAYYLFIRHFCQKHS